MLRPWLLLPACLCALVPLLACGAPGVVVGSSPRWACPSPVPKPWGTSGPVKEVQRTLIGTATPSGDEVFQEEPIYFEEWEQEYPDQGPPFPSPTPYARIGTHYSFGQRVEIGPLHATVNARAGQIVNEPGLPADRQQLYFVEIAWVNRSLQPIPIIYAEHVRLRAVTAPDGAVVSDARWGMSTLSLRLAGMDAPPDSIPEGTSEVTIPILAPPGQPETVEVAFAGVPGYFPPMPSATTLPGTPTSTPEPEATPSPTPLPNEGLRAPGASPLLVQWTAGEWRAPGGPVCNDAGALTAWSVSEGVAWGVDVPVSGVVAPPGAARVVQLALNQVGKRYVWGAKGPETFDCSGLVSWAYAQIGIRIPQGTAGQWPQMTAVDGAALQPGDLVFFDIDRDGRVDHVGMLAGDLDGDGQWDMVHAANPMLGVRIESAILRSAFYAPRITGFRTARVGGAP